MLLIAILTGFASPGMGERGDADRRRHRQRRQVFFGIIGLIVQLAPIGAFGAMAFTIGKYGIGALGNLGALIGTFYLTACCSCWWCWAPIARLAGFSILRFIAYIKDELLIVLGTSSSETALPQMMAKMERLGASQVGRSAS